MNRDGRSSNRPIVSVFRLDEEDFIAEVTTIGLLQIPASATSIKADSDSVSVLLPSILSREVPSSVRVRIELIALFHVTGVNPSPGLLREADLARGEPGVISSGRSIAEGRGEAITSVPITEKVLRTI